MSHSGASLLQERCQCVWKGARTVSISVSAVHAPGALSPKPPATPHGPHCPIKRLILHARARPGGTGPGTEGRERAKHLRPRSRDREEESANRTVPKQKDAFRFAHQRV
ncbi:hypothetical protein WMY93_028879 [Mugilogobius chulae]|uniref:Uncharacterized protein n=1 Tax=Mugilogobius chulae TaxID=88201 RepID=A0AAW0MRJ0_9GOBI